MCTPERKLANVSDISELGPSKGSVDSAPRPSGGSDIARKLPPTDNPANSLDWVCPAAHGICTDAACAIPTMGRASCRCRIGTVQARIGPAAEVIERRVIS
jgi:hypothetical protein